MTNQHTSLIKTARLTGVWYLIMAISGLLGFMFIHPQIYISNDPAKTLANITEQTILARIRLLFEFSIIVSQALTAIWFYKLFKSINDWAAWSLGLWGTVNSVVIMISAISMGTAIEIANGSVLSMNEKIIFIHLLERVSSNAWSVGNLFFGLWLIPMGSIVVKSQRMPVWLGRILIIGGYGYLLSAFIKYSGFANPFIDMLVIPATVGEFWMIGYLLVYGIRELKE